MNSTKSRLKPKQPKKLEEELAEFILTLFDKKKKGPFLKNHP